MLEILDQWGPWLDFFHLWEPEIMYIKSVYMCDYVPFVPKNWCFWIVVLEKTLESPLDHKAIKPVNPKGN